MRVGICGIGFMGMVHYLTYQAIDGVEVVALAEPDEKRLAGDWTGIKGNFGPQGTQMDLSGVANYSSATAMIEEADLDYLDICLPPGMHTEVAVEALSAGRNVFCEKPMALTTDDCDLMLAAAAKTDCRLLIGHVLPFFAEYAKALEIIHSGEYGRLLGGSFQRVISDPQWLPNFYDPKKIGGPMLDLHVHDAHFIRLLFGLPHAVCSTGRMRKEVAEYWHTMFDYGEKGPCVTATSGVLRHQGRPFLHGFEIQMESATLYFEFAVLGEEPHVATPLTLISVGGEVSQPDLRDADPMLAFDAELREVVDCMKDNRDSKILAGQLARDAVFLCNRQTESIATRTVVKL